MSKRRSTAEFISIYNEESGQLAGIQGETAMNPVDILRYGHFTWIGSVKRIAEGDWDIPTVCGVWSAKDVFAHLTSYELVLVDILGSFVEGSATPTLDVYLATHRTFNDDQVNARRGMTLSEIQAEYAQAHERVLELAPRVAAERWRENGSLSWYGAEYSLDDYVVYSFYGHKREHSAQLDVFADSRRA